MIVSCILLTTHPKRAEYLPDAIRSYYGQTYPHKELVVVNDGPQAIESWGPDVTVVNLPYRRTIGEKRNIGLRAAKGDYLATWDDDDISLPGRLAEQVACAVEHDADLILTSTAHIANESMQVVGMCERGPVFPTQASALYRRSIIIRAGGYGPKDYLEDFEMLERCRLLVQGRILVFGMRDWYVQRRHDRNITLQYGYDGSATTCALEDPEQGRIQRVVDYVRSLPLPPGAPR